MKIIWITPECPYPPNTGGRSGVWNRIINLAKNNEIYLFCISEKDDYKNITYIEKYCKIVKFYDRNNSFITLVKSIFNPFPAVSRWNKNMNKDIFYYCDKINPDYIIVDFPQMLGNVPLELSKKYKIVLCQHNTEYMALKNISTGIKNPFKKIVYKIVAKQLEIYESKVYNKYNIELFTFVSIEDKTFFEKKYNKKNTLLVPVGANIVNETCNNANDIIFVAKMSYPPNNEAAIWFLENVWDDIHKKNNYCKFYIVGKDPSDELKKLAKKYDNVIITGIVDSVEKYYNLAKIVVIPLFTGGGVKVKLLEALGHKKIVVTTTKGIEGTDFINYEHLIVADTPNDFSKVCIDILANDDKYKTIKDKAATKIKNEYSWEKVTKNFENVLLQKIGELENHNEKEK